MANHKIKEFFISDLFWPTSDYISEDMAKTDFFYQLALLFADVTFTDKDNNTIPMDFFEIGTSGTNKNGRWLQCTEEYVKTQSGNKITSDYLDEAYDDFYNYIQNPTSSPYITTAQWRAKCIAKVIFNKYQESWCRIWYAMTVKYRPLDNYDRTESQQSSGRNLLNTNGWDTSKQGSVSTTAASDTYGFSSSTGVDKDSSTSTSTPSNNISATNTAIPGNQQQIGENASQSAGTSSGSLSINAHGNIGVTMTQTMLQNELNARTKINFYNIVYKNIDEILTCSCYGTAGDNMED